MSACNAEDLSSIPGSGRSLEKEMATHSSILAWRIPWMEEPGGLHAVHGVTKSRTRLSDFTFFHFHILSTSLKCKLSVIQYVHGAIHPIIPKRYPLVVECVCEHAQPCPTLSDPMDCSPPGSSVHGIFHGSLG